LLLYCYFRFNLTRELVLASLGSTLERAWLCAVVACLPEGVRLLSVFLRADEYRELIQRCSSSDQLTVKPTDPVQDTGIDRHVVHSEYASVAAAGDTGDVTEESGKQTGSEEVFAGSDTKLLTQRHGRRSSDTDDTAAVVYEPSVISGKHLCSFLAAHEVPIDATEASYGPRGNPLPLIFTFPPSTLFKHFLLFSFSLRNRFLSFLAFASLPVLPE